MSDLSCLIIAKKQQTFNLTLFSEIANEKVFFVRFFLQSGVSQEEIYLLFAAIRMTRTSVRIS